MRAPFLGSTAALLAVLVPGATAAFLGCDGSKNNGASDAATALDTGAPETQDGALPGDGPAPNDATVEAGGGEEGGAEEDGSNDGGVLGFAEGGGFSGDCGGGTVGEPTDLRCTGLYADWTSKTVAVDAGITEYDPGLHFWSDGADKTRWIYLPPGQQNAVIVSDRGRWPAQC